MLNTQSSLAQQGTNDECFVSAIAAVELPVDQWPDFVEILFGFINTSDDTNLKTATLQAIGYTRETMAAKAWCFYNFQITTVTPRPTHFSLTPISMILPSANTSLTSWTLFKRGYLFDTMDITQGAKTFTLRLTHFSSTPISRILPSANTPLTPWTSLKDSAQREYLFDAMDTTSRKASLSERARSRVSKKIYFD
ncbi:hypothetical protein BDR07DRAFT_1482558 [Suillus spraguei]|nr:hypothetical protein BDR07DRAFT_1482558 [Suillus spraguei]